MGIVIPAIYCGVMKSLWLIFDDSRMGSAIQDFLDVIKWLKAKDQLIQLDTLLESYNEYQDFDVRELSLIEHSTCDEKWCIISHGYSTKALEGSCFSKNLCLVSKSKTFGLNNSLYLKGQVEQR